MCSWSLTSHRQSNIASRAFRTRHPLVWNTSSTTSWRSEKRRERESKRNEPCYWESSSFARKHINHSSQAHLRFSPLMATRLWVSSTWGRLVRTLTQTFPNSTSRLVWAVALNSTQKTRLLPHQYQRVRIPRELFRILLSLLPSRVFCKGSLWRLQLESSSWLSKRASSQEGGLYTLRKIKRRASKTSLSICPS